MRKSFVHKVAIVCLLFFIANASADTLRQHMQSSMDCDGILLVIDADVMQIDDRTDAYQYHVTPLDTDFCVQFGSTVDWAQYGCDLSIGQWIQDNAYYHTNPVTSEFFGVYRFCSMVISRHPQELYQVLEVLGQAFPEQYLSEDTQVDGLSLQEVDDIAARTASLCGLSVVERELTICWDNIRNQVSADQIRIWFNTDLNAISDDELSAMRGFDVYYAVSWQGLQLLSVVDLPAMSGETSLLNLTLHLHASVQEGIVYLSCPLFDSVTQEATGGKVMTSTDAINLLTGLYSNIYLPDVSRIMVRQINMEYVAITGDSTASKGFTLYPVWWMEMLVETTDGSTYTEIHGFHAVTGQQLF